MHARLIPTTTTSTCQSPGRACLLAGWGVASAVACPAAPRVRGRCRLPAVATSAASPTSSAAKAARGRCRPPAATTSAAGAAASSTTFAAKAARVRCRPPAAATSASAAASSTTSAAKAALFDALASTQGARASISRSTRGLLEEAVVGLEACAPPDGHDWRALLPGRWRLAFTTAADVGPFLILAGAIPRPLAGLLPDAGAIFQEFDEPNNPDPDAPVEGEVRNVIQAGAPPFLRPGDGLTATVRARYTARSGRRLRLRFESASVSDAHLSGLGEALLAPAALPGRGWLQQRAVLGVAEAGFTIPLRGRLPSALQPVADALEKEVGSDYLVTYLDGDTLIGRQTGTGGLFVFFRE